MDSFSLAQYELFSKEILLADTCLLRFAGRLDFVPGQFVRLSLDHLGEIAVAPCSDPHDQDFFELCIRGAGSTSNEVIKALPGDHFGIRGPYGNGWPLNSLAGEDIVLIAGGLGLVPLRPAIIQIIRNRHKYGKVTLLFGAKTSGDILFLNDLITWRKKIDVEIAAEYLCRPSDKDFCTKGRITEPLDRLEINAKKTVALICGPEIMYKFCIDSLLQKGLAEDRIYASYERRMECGIGICQHCNIGKYMVCQDGPVFAYSRIKGELQK